MKTLIRRKIMSKNPKAGQSTARAAKQFKRRMLLKSGVALAALTPVVPLYVKNAFAASPCPEFKRCASKTNTIFLPTFCVFR